MIVVEMHGLHLGFLGCYGAEGAATTAFDRTAAHGVTFDQHFADCPGAARRTSWTGRYDFSFVEAAAPDEHPAAATLPELLKTHGVPAKFLTAASADGQAETDLADCLSAGVDAGLAAVEDLAWGTHAVVWVDLPSLAPPWLVSAEDGDAGAFWPDPPGELPDGADDEQIARLQETYAAVLGLFDEELGRFLDALEAGGYFDDGLLCVTARQGLSLAERGLIGTNLSSCHEELVHLPLLLRLPRAAEAGRRVAALTQPVDLLPTLLEAVGVPTPANLHGRSLWPHLHGQAEALRPYAAAGVAHAGRAGLWLRTPAWAYLRSANEGATPPARPPLLFAKPEDRWEVTNLVQVYEPWAEHLDQTVRAFVSTTRAAGPLHAPPLRDLEAVLEEAVAGVRPEAAPGLSTTYRGPGRGLWD